MKNIVLYGDSITEGFNTGTILPAFNILNRGVYGTNSIQLITELPSRLNEDEPDIVFMMIGINDFAIGLNQTKIIENAGIITKILKTKVNPENIYYTSILPTRFIENRPNLEIEKINLENKKMAADEGINYFDLFSKMTDENGLLSGEYTDDGLHISKKGYLRWAEELTPVLEGFLK